MKDDVGAPRWRLEELAARYELEPELKDIYVEGLLTKDSSLGTLLQPDTKASPSMK